MVSEFYRMRQACKCGGAFGEIREKGAQDCVHCLDCGKWVYNAPRIETGKEVRTVKTTHAAISTSKRARIIFGRANGRCEVCGGSAESGKELHVGHVVSVEVGLEMGLTEVEINSDENLIALCAECNLGLGKNPFPVRLAVRLLMAHAKCSEMDRKETA